MRISQPIYLISFRQVYCSISGESGHAEGGRSVLYSPLKLYLHFGTYHPEGLFHKVQQMTHNRDEKTRILVLQAVDTALSPHPGRHVSPLIAM